MYIIKVNAFDKLKSKMVELESLERGCKESAKRKALEWLSGDDRYEVTGVTGVRKL